jgi:heme-degrading monooxygenase HmoA
VNRRKWLQGLIAAAPVAAQSRTDKPIQLHCDLAVDPTKEQEMLRIFRDSFRPAAAKQPGFIDVTMIKLRSALQGKAPAGANYRFLLIFQSEELRQKWVTSDVHQHVWPMMEKTLTSKDYTVLLYDVAT